MFNQNVVFFKCIREFIEGKTTKEDIENFENEYNIKLTEDFKEFLINYNGVLLDGYYEINNLKYILFNKYLENTENGASDFEVFEDLPQIIGTMKEYLGNEELSNRIDLVKNEKILPIIRDMSANGDIGIGYGKDNFGKMFVWGISPFEGVEFLCNSFREFIEGYYLTKIDEIDEETGEPIGEKIYTLEGV
ncbi:MAG: SMI1/KNR4 family protein [Candidatus Sericytochromatia bacterium]